MLLDYAVRGLQAQPPLAVLAGLPYTLWTSAEVIVSHLLWMRVWGLPGMLLHLAVCVGTLTLDGLLSNSFGENVRWLRANGFSDLRTVATIAFNLVASQSLGFLVVYLICTETLDPRDVLDAAVLGKVLVNMAIGEALFTASHRALHRRLAGLHRMHHCCRRASWTTNLIFHPVDLALEFAGPVGALLVTHYLVWDQDQLVLLVSYVVLQLWYGLDHDEYLKLYHYRHHLVVDSVYTIYVRIADSNPRLDRVKALLVAPPAVGSK